MINREDMEPTIPLTKFIFYNATLNISKRKPNQSNIQLGDGKPWINIALLSGGYDLDELYQEISHQLRDTHGSTDQKKSFFEPHIPTFRVIII